MDQPSINPGEINSIKGIVPSILKGGLLEVITAHAGITPDNLPDIFSPTEITKASSYMNERRRTEYLGGRYALKMLLARRLPPHTPLHLIAIDSDSKGAPFVRLETNDHLHQISLNQITPLLSSCMVSLTHKAQTIMAVIAPAANFHGLGIDLEYRPPQRNIDRAKDRMIDLIGNLEESSVIKQELAQLRQEPGVLISPAADTDPFLVLFSIKEASYKALRGEATTLKKIALTSFSPHAISGLTLPCFRSTLRYDGQDIEAVTLALRCFQISIAWF